MVPAARANFIRLRLLGPPALILDEAPVPLAVTQKAIALLVLLTSNHATPLPRSRLAELLWPDVTDEEARTNLRRQLHLLTKVIDADAFILTKNSAQWNDCAFPSDVAAFQRCAQHPEQYERAVAMWNGEPAAGVHDDALAEVRERLTRQYAALLHDLANRSRAQAPADALCYFERLSAIDPLDEFAARELIEARFDSGDRSGALHEYNMLAQRLQTQLGVAPDGETAALFQRIVYSTKGSASPHNLVVPSTSFVGREAELGNIASAIARQRIVTLAGPAGVGKTRLALKTGLNHLDDYLGGVWFIDLSTAQDLDGICSHAAQVLGAPGDPIAALRDRHVLVLLDNCEHILDDVRSFIERIARETDANVLATSRHKVECDGEFVVVIDPLPLPPQRISQPAHGVAPYAAIRLFLERSVTVAPSFRLSDENAHIVTDIVRRLDGLPLALELVAARAGLLTAEGMLKRLSDLSAFSARHTTIRHSTLEAALQWSHALLSPIEQRVFARLSVFAGDFTLEAAQRTCGDICADVLPVLSELVESSLVYTRFAGAEPRFALLETVRIFATDRLREANEIEIAHSLHAAHFAELARLIAPDFVREQDLQAYRRCDLDAANFLAALRRSSSEDPALALRLIASLWRYWIFRWTFEEARAVLHTLLESPTFEREPVELRAQAYQAAGMFEKERADADAAKTYFERALEQCRAGHLPERELEVLNALAILEFNHGDPREAGKLYEACLEMQQRTGDTRAAAETIANLGAVAQSMNQYERAFSLFERALETFRAIGHWRGVGYALRSLTLCCEMLGRYDEGVRYGNECIAVYERLGEQARLADGLQTLSNLRSVMGDQREAIRLAAQALHILSKVEHPIFTMLSLFGYAIASLRAGKHLEAARAFAKAWTLRETKHLSVQEENLVLFTQQTETLKALLGERQFDIAWAHGKSLSIDQIAHADGQPTEEPPDGSTLN